MRFDGDRQQQSSKQQDGYHLYRDSFDRSVRQIPKPRSVPCGIANTGNEDTQDYYSRQDGYTSSGYPRSTRNNPRASRKSESDNYRDEDYYTTKRTPVRRRSRHHSPRRRNIVNFLNQDWDYVQKKPKDEILKKKKEEEDDDDEYRGGYDFHDDVDSINSLEAKKRRQDRTERVRMDRRPKQPISSLLRKTPRYSDRDWEPSVTLHSSRRRHHRESNRFFSGSRYRAPRTTGLYHFDEEGSQAQHRRRLEQLQKMYDQNYDTNRRNSKRSRNFKLLPGSSETDSISYDESSVFSEDYDDESMESDSGSCSSEENMSTGRHCVDWVEPLSRNPQLLHATTVPELPLGYLRRKDGVVISIASSSQSMSDRYVKGGKRRGRGRRGNNNNDDDDSAKQAAEAVVEDLRNLGFYIHDQNGILGSNSDSGTFSEFRGPLVALSRTEPTISEDPLTSHVIPNPTFLRATTVEGILVNPNTLLPSQHRVKAVPVTKSQGTKLSQQQQRRQGPIDNYSKGTRTMISPVVRPERSKRQIQDPQQQILPFDDSSTIMADGSTITSVPTSQDGKQETEIVFDKKEWKENNPISARFHRGQPLFLAASRNRNDETVRNKYELSKVVTKIPHDGIATIVSDLSSSFHPSELSPTTPEEQQQQRRPTDRTVVLPERPVVHAFRRGETHLVPVDNLCDRLILTCHIAAFPPLKTQP